MDRSEYRRHFELERDFWWFRSRRAVAFRILDRALRGRGGPVRILDAGCGTGLNLIELGARGLAFGCDLAPEALAFCRERGLARLARADIRRLPVSAGAFDLVTLFDVLYHKEIPDDVEVLGEAGRALKAGGLLLVTDSALESLRGPHDEAMQGARRYDKKTLRTRLEAAGFDVIRLTYFFTATLPAIYLKRRIDRGRAIRRPETTPRSDLGSVPGWLNRLLAGLLKPEAAWASRWNLPIGSSIIALARKRDI